MPTSPELRERGRLDGSEALGVMDADAERARPRRRRRLQRRRERVRTGLLGVDARLVLLAPPRKARPHHQRVHGGRPRRGAHRGVLDQRNRHQPRRGVGPSRRGQPRRVGTAHVPLPRRRPAREWLAVESDARGRPVPDPAGHLVHGKSGHGGGAAVRTGGEQPRLRHGDERVVDPAAIRRRPAPHRATRSNPRVWTGTELLFLNDLPNLPMPGSATPAPPASGWAYSPASNVWREIPGFPAEPTRPQVAGDFVVDYSPPSSHITGEGVTQGDRRPVAVHYSPR